MGTRNYYVAQQRPVLFFRSSDMDVAVAPSAQGCAVGAAEKEEHRSLVVLGGTVNPINEATVRRAAP
ncbi:MAG: hypothetical protein ABW098_06375 [Candidatus Thiodiazotropha sp.]